MRRALLLATLAVPTVFAFAGGGTSDVAEATFVVVCCLLAVLATPFWQPQAPVARASLPVLGGLALLALLTMLSGGWTDDPGGWLQDSELVAGYLALTWAAAALLSSPQSARHLVEPVLAIGTVVVIGYGLITRMLSDLITVEVSTRAGGRLDAPLGYWNAVGIMAAIGLVLCARLAADPRRSPALRAAALSSVPLLAVGIQLSYSRSAIAAAVAGLLLIALRGTIGQLRTCAAVVGASALGVLAMLPFAEVRHGPTVSSTGAWCLSLLAAACLLVGWTAMRRIASIDADTRWLGPRSRRVGAALVVIVALLPIGAALVSSGDTGGETFGSSASRLTQTSSNRAHYWRVALDEFTSHPVAGGGAGSFRNAWLRERTIDENVLNAHSIWLETTAELGALGLLLIVGIAVGVIQAVRRADREATTGAAAVLITWAVGASVDWHWQLPAVTAIPFVMVGLVLVARTTDAGRGPATAG